MTSYNVNFFNKTKDTVVLHVIFIDVTWQLWSLSWGWYMIDAIIFCRIDVLCNSERFFWDFFFKFCFNLIVSMSVLFSLTLFCVISYYCLSVESALHLLYNFRCALQGMCFLSFTKWLSHHTELWKAKSCELASLWPKRLKNINTPYLQLSVNM